MGIVSELLPNFRHSVKLFGMALVSETFPNRNNRNSLCMEGASHITMCDWILGFLLPSHFSAVCFLVRKHVLRYQFVSCVMCIFTCLVKHFVITDCEKRHTNKFSLRCRQGFPFWIQSLCMCVIQSQSAYFTSCRSVGGDLAVWQCHSFTGVSRKTRTTLSCRKSELDEEPDLPEHELGLITQFPLTSQLCKNPLIWWWGKRYKLRSWYSPSI